jgi:5-oxopent-3-ene-1,2,5-tricarboxylate decarboxylase/2-hydroxyhepta-2,4-diene-1,7-dioate isomerase
MTMGTIYGVLLNDRASIERLAEEFGKEPYKVPPKAPILYIKPVNTVSHGGATVLVPGAPGTVQIGSTIAAVIGASASRVSRQQALSHVTGFRLVADLSLPHGSFYRPAIRERCRDGFCPLGSLNEAADFDVHQAVITTSINQQVVQTWSLANAVRKIDELIADVSEFMTLERSDLLLLGLSDQPPTGRPGDVINIEATGFKPLAFHIESELEQALQ